MTTDVLSRLAGPINAASGDNTVFTPDEGHKGWVLRIVVANNTAAKVTIKIGINSSADANLIFPAIGVPARGTLDRETFHILSDADSLIVNASATGATVTVSGYDRYPTL